MYVFLRPLVVFKWDGLACHKTRFNHTVGSVLSSARPKSGQYNHCSYLYIVSVFLSCVHVYFFLVVGCFGYFCFQVHSFQLQFCTPFKRGGIFTPTDYSWSFCRRKQFGAHFLTKYTLCSLFWVSRRFNNLVNTELRQKLSILERFFCCIFGMSSFEHKE